MLMPSNNENQNDDLAVERTVHLAAENDRRFVAVMDGVVFTAHVVAEGSGFVAVMDGLELKDTDGNPFIANVNGLEVEGSGSTVPQAQDALIRSMRGWLERLDTSGKLPEALGTEDLAEETEVILQFIDGAEAEKRRADVTTRRPPPADRSYGVDWEYGVSVHTFRG